MSNRSSPMDPESLEDVFSNLPQLLGKRLKEIEAKEKDLEAREDALRREVNGAEPSGVLELNVGGRTDIVVLRRTLTSVKGSMLAAKFSGRWDDNLEKDSEERIFIDVDLEPFLELVTYLRKNAMQIPGDGPVPLESPPVLGNLVVSQIKYEY